MISYEDLATAAIVFLALVSVFNLLMSALKNGKELTKPQRDVKVLIENHNNMLENVNLKLDKYNNTLIFILKSLAVIVDHDIHGNNIEELKSIKREINDFLSK